MTAGGWVGRPGNGDGKLAGRKGLARMIESLFSAQPFLFPL